MKYIYFLLLICFFSSYSQISLPYSASFDNPTSDEDWTHYAISGSDDWERGFASGSIDNNNLSWETKLNGTPTIQSNMALESPTFDLTNASLPYVISFNYKSNINSNSKLFLEYTINNGTDWQLLDNNFSLRKNWQSVGGFVLSSSGFEYNSALNLAFLAGFNNVKFRFRFTTGSSCYGYGVVIDDFSIEQEYYNVFASAGTPIEISPLCPTLKVETNLNFKNQYSNYFTLTTKYYLSNDALLDNGDTLLGQKILTLNQTSTDFDISFTTPTGIIPGLYYVLFKHDANNILPENNENDNIGYCTLTVKEIFNLPYSTDFETIDENWKANQYPNSTEPIIWEKGLGYRHHLEMAHSGNNAWHTSKTYLKQLTYGEKWVESPYFNLNSVNVPIYLNFWNKNSRESGGTYKIDYSTNCSPAWTNLITIPENLSDEWENITILLNNAISTNTNIKFRITYNKGYFNPEGIIFDDFYVGPAKSDLSIEKIYSNNRYSSSDSSSDFLKYEIQNAGMLTVNSAVTKFYWSNDTTLDANDVYLGEQSVSNFTQAGKQWMQFNYSKPTTTSGNYFIIYKIDANNEVTELRENDNIGFIPIEQLQTTIFPYFNDFETQVNNWKHETTLGQDDWQYETPNGIALNQAFSGTKAWIATTTSNSISQMSRMHLYTPVFNLSNSINPVLEFDMKLENYGCTCSDFHINLSYSIDNGATWKILNPINESFSKWQKIQEYSENSGLDLDYGIPSSLKMFDRSEIVLTNYKQYNSRDIDRNTKYIVNIPQLANETNIRFRYNIATELNTLGYVLEGVIIDNFKISEGVIDLTVPNSKNLLISPQANKLNFSIDIKNNGNLISNQTTIKFYLSNNNIFDSGDLLIGNSTLMPIKPDRKQNKSLEFVLPNNLNDYSYLVYEIDGGNLNSETDENNNVGFWSLGLSGVTTFPYSEKFEEAVYNGWHGFSYEPYQIGTLANYRVTNKIPITSKNNTTLRLYNGVLMTEYVPYGNWQIGQTPQYYIQSPSFNFSNYTSTEPLTMVFDVMSIGKGFTNGTNMEYSLNGGSTWTLLTQNTAPNVNWYPSFQIMSDVNEPGWFGSSSEMITSKMNISFLQNETDVIFRYKFKSNFATASINPRGFRLDNFAIGSESEVNLINCIENVPNLMPFDYDFQGTCWENGVNTNELILYNRGSNQDIQWSYSTNFAGVQNNCSVKIDLIGQGNTNGVWLVSPKYNITDPTTFLRFNIALNAFGTTSSSNLDINDQIILYYTIDNGLNWEELKTWNNTSPISNSNQLEEFIDLPTSEFVRFAFWATNGASNTNSNTTFYIDNFALNTASLNTENYDKVILNYFPNPVKDFFNISSQNKLITSISISNSIGQLLETKSNINIDKYSLDFQNYPNGMYIVSIYFYDKKKTIKIIKQ